MAVGFVGGRPEAGSCLTGSSFPPRPRELAVRLGCGPCQEEQAFLSRRKQVVAKALKQALQLDDDLQEDEVWGLGCRGWVSWVCWGPELSVESWTSAGAELGSDPPPVRLPLLCCPLTW